MERVNFIHDLGVLRKTHNMTDIRVEMNRRFFRIYLCFPKHKSSGSDQDKIIENEMITFYALGGEFFSIRLRLLE